MKQRLHLLFPAFLALAFIPACNNVVEEEAPSAAKTRLFHARIGELPEARAYASRENGILYMVWHADDQISIFDHSTRNRRYRFLGSDGDHDGDFEEVATSGEGAFDPVPCNVAVYPYNPDYTCDAGGNVSLAFPGSQSYRADNFDPAAALMLAESEDLDLSFLHLGAYFVIQLYGEGVSVRSITLEANDHQALSGQMTAWVDGDQVVSEFAGYGTGESITLTAASPVALGATSAEAVPFWFCVPPVTMNDGFTVTVRDAEDRPCVLRSDRAFTFSRSHLIRMKARQVIPEEEAPTALGIHFDGEAPVLFDAASQQFSVYKAEGKVWIRMVDLPSLSMYQLGPVPADAAPGDEFDVSLEHISFLNPGENTVAPYNVKVSSVENRVITLRAAGEAWFVLRF